MEMITMQSGEPS